MGTGLWYKQLHIACGASLLLLRLLLEFYGTHYAIPSPSRMTAVLGSMLHELPRHWCLQEPQPVVLGKNDCALQQAPCAGACRSLRFSPLLQVRVGAQSLHLMVTPCQAPPLCMRSEQHTVPASPRGK